MNKTLKKNSSFTLIELLVVIVIIGILAGLVTIAATSFINNSHNARMVAELAGISKKLIGETEFPAGNFCMEDGSSEAKKLLDFLEMEKAPKHPLYKGEDHLTTNECFLYFSDGEHYSIRVPTVGNKGYLIQESRNPNPQGIQEKCEEGWIPFGNRCVMKYEAKAQDNNGDIVAFTDNTYTLTDYTAVSVPDGNPWVCINQYNAKVACESIGAHLITNAEWMALARDIEAQDVNWTDGKVGEGVLRIGNAGSNSTNGSSYNGPKPDYVGRDPQTTTTDRSSTSPARLFLSNGQEVWDFSGNVWEWVNDTITVENLPITAGTVTFSNASFHAIYLPQAEVVPLKAISSSLGGGVIYSSSSDVNDPRGFLRGSSTAYGSNAGIFTLNLCNPPTVFGLGGTMGFRCVR
jgi:prepilin-type N-terminal cleavage/methylation domain-containing protein